MPMSMDEMTLNIGGLLEVAEAQQQAITAQLEQLKQQTAALAQATAQVNAAREQAIRALQEAAGAAIRDGVRDALSQTAKTALAALEGVSEPVTARWAVMTQEAQAAEIKLRRAVAWFSWRWVALIGAVGAGVIASIMLAAKGLVWWEEFQINSLLRQRAALTEEVSQLEATAENWRKKAGRANLNHCNGRLCVQVDERAGRWAFPNCSRLHLSEPVRAIIAAFLLRFRDSIFSAVLTLTDSIPALLAIIRRLLTLRATEGATLK